MMGSIHGRPDSRVCTCRLHICLSALRKLIDSGYVDRTPSTRFSSSILTLLQRPDLEAVWFWLPVSPGVPSIKTATHMSIYVMSFVTMTTLTVSEPPCGFHILPQYAPWWFPEGLTLSQTHILLCALSPVVDFALTVCRHAPQTPGEPLSLLWSISLSCTESLLMKYHRCVTYFAPIDRSGVRRQTTNCMCAVRV